jgi:alpha-tubulin suppressor-like RCC1 family protein
MKNRFTSTAAIFLTALALFTLTTTPTRAGTGYALSFRYKSDQCMTATIPALASNYTLTAWVFLRAGGNLPSMRVGVLGATNSGGSVELLVRSATANDTDPQYLELGRDTSFNGTASTGTVPTNQWVHLAVTVSSNKTVSYFINGVAAGTWDASSRNLMLGANICLANNVSATRKFDGVLDEVEIWSRALGAAEIRANMNQTPNVADASLAAYWPFAEGGRIGVPADITADASGSGCNGTLANRPAWVLSPVPNTMVMKLAGANPLTNECHTAFTDPGAAIWAAPVSIAAGDLHSLALKADGSVVAWGDNSYGQTNVPASATNVVAVAAGAYHNLVLKADGSVVGWGDNSDGQISVPASATNIVAIATGHYYHSLALKADGSVVAWGDNSYGQTSVPASAKNVIAIAANEMSSLALKADGSILMWGNLTKQKVPASATNVVAIAAGDFHSLALRADGSVVAWGINDHGATNVPASATNVVAIAAGYFNSVALRADGSVVAWGDNSYGQTNVPASATNVIAIATECCHCLAIKTDGSVIAWGFNDSGETDIPASVDYPDVPVTIGGAVNANSPGSYVLAYTWTNALGSILRTNRTVVVADTTPPALTLFGNNPCLITNASRAFTDPGAMAYDACGGSFAVTTNSNVNLNFPGTYTITYRSTDSYGNTATTNRTVYVVLPPAVAGDLNGDGVVNASEAAAVMQNYWVTTANRITGLTSLGRGQFEFGLTNTPGLNFTVLVSTNLTNWTVLTNAAPEFLFNDATATNAPQRYYRLRWP